MLNTSDGGDMIKFNMNNYVWFEPTELGEKVYNDYFTQLGFEEPHNKLKIIDVKLNYNSIILFIFMVITSPRIFAKIRKYLNIMSFILMRRNYCD